MTRPAWLAGSRVATVSMAAATGLFVLAAFTAVHGRAPALASSVAITARSTVASAVASLVAATDAGGSAGTPWLRPAPTPPATAPPAAGAMPRLSPAPTATATATDGLARSTPVRLRIEAIDVDTDLVGLGLEADGTMEVPDGAFPAGWYRGAPTPGELGPAVIVGHVDWAGTSGVFADLGGLRAGDEVAVTREDGTTAVFAVTGVQRVAKDAFPTLAVYGDLDHPGLRLITCGGVFDDEAASYEDNVIVFAELDRVTGDAATRTYNSSLGSPPS